MNRPSYLLFKQCSKCGEILHVSKFNKLKSGKYGVEKWCKECRSKYKKHWRKENKDKVEKYYEENKNKILKYQNKYYNENKDYINSRNKKYAENHKEEICEYQKKYREEHEDYYKEYKKEYAKNNPDKIFNQKSKRRFKENTQGDGIDKIQWLEMMNFFDWKCAYSDEYIGGDSDKRTIDHIVALDNGGEHEIWNLVPMYSNYNFQKNTKNMLDWYIQQDYFDIDRLTKIYEWRIYAYWKWKE